jgi:hypothetical protein
VPAKTARAEPPKQNLKLNYSGEAQQIIRVNLRETRNSIYAASVEPTSILRVEVLDVVHVPGAQEVKEGRQFHTCCVPGVVQVGLNLGQKVLVSGAVFLQAGKSLLF